MSDLQTKLKTMQGLLPSQRQWMERLTFQLEFNPYQLVHIVGGLGSGKSTLCLAIAELLSDHFNLALLKVEPGLPAFLIRQHLLESWFGFCPDGSKPLMQLIGERQSNLPLALVLDQSENVPSEIWAELSQVPCLVVAASLQADPHAELNLPLAPITLEDAEQLLQGHAFSTLTVADRLDQAEGNLHVLLDPATKPKLQIHDRKTPAKPASVWPPLVTFLLGMMVIGAVVVFWFWTERDLRQQPGVGQLTYLPQEEEIAAPAIVETKVKQVESKKVVKELVDKLDVVKGDAGSVASGMALPERFDDSADTNQLPATIDSESVAANTQSATEAIEELQVVDAKPIVEAKQSGSEDSLPESTMADADTLPTKVNSERQATGTTDELPNSTDLPASQQLAPETTFEDEIAAELQTSQTVKSSVTETVTAETKEVPVVATNVDELASENDEASVKNTTAEQLANFRFSEAELLGLSTDAKALQLVVFSNENALDSFKQSYPKLQTLTYARTKNGQKQLVVVMAPFNDSALAKSKISALPAAFQNAFVKSIAEIHSEISAN